MTTFAQELTGRYVAAVGHRRDTDARRTASAVFVRDTIRTIYDVDKNSGTPRPTTALSPNSSTPPRKHLEHIVHDVSRSATTPPNTGGDTA